MSLKSCALLPIASRILRPELGYLSLAVLPLTAVLITTSAYGQLALPDDSGRTLTHRLCAECHEIGKSVSLRQDVNGWSTTLAKMVGFGMKATEEELGIVLAYLVKDFPPSALPPLNVNKARAIQFESRLSLKRSEATKIIRYRRKNGGFKSIEDLKKVPGINVALIEAKKDSLIFD